jgi:hypothetical protein
MFWQIGGAVDTTAPVRGHLRGHVLFATATGFQNRSIRQ